jgi:hypothetical protein
MRGTPNEYVSYNINPAESHERFARALHLIRRAWTETRPFGWLGPLLPVPHGFDLAAARAAAARAPSHVRLQPRGRGVRSAQPYRHRLRLAPCRSRRARCSTTAPAPATPVGSPRRRTSFTAPWSMSPTRTTRLLPSLSTPPPRISLVDQNKAVVEGVLQSGYYGADALAQRQRASRARRPHRARPSDRIGRPALDVNVCRTYNARLLPRTASLERSPMPEIVADSPARSCSLLLSGVGIQESQPLGSDLFPPRARGAQEWRCCGDGVPFSQRWICASTISIWRIL